MTCLQFLCDIQCPMPRAATQSARPPRPPRLAVPPSPFCSPSLFTPTFPTRDALVGSSPRAGETQMEALHRARRRALCVRALLLSCLSLTPPCELYVSSFSFRPLPFFNRCSCAGIIKATSPTGSASTKGGTERHREKILRRARISFSRQSPGALFDAITARK